MVPAKRFSGICLGSSHGYIQCDYQFNVGLIIIFIQGNGKNIILECFDQNPFLECSHSTMTGKFLFRADDPFLTLPVFSSPKPQKGEKEKKKERIVRNGGLSHLKNGCCRSRQKFVAE